MVTSRRGFTLVELMITVALIGIIGLIAVPNIFSSIPQYRVNSAAKVLASEMNLSRMRAIAKNRSYVVEFNASDQKIVVSEEDPVTGALTVTKTLLFDSAFPGVSLDFNNVTGPDGSTVSQAATFGSSSPPEAVFRPNGLLVEGGIFYLMPTADIDKRNDRLRALQISRAGQVTLYRFKQGATPPWEEF